MLFTFFVKNNAVFLEMDTRLFYGNLRYVNEISNGHLSEDEYISDTDEEDFKIQPSYEEHIYIPETDDSDDYDKPTTSNAKSAKKRATIWKERSLPTYSNENFSFVGDMNLPEFIEELETPAELFASIFTDDLINFIVDQSNLYSLQNDINKPANITRKEMDQFIGKFN